MSQRRIGSCIRPDTKEISKGSLDDRKKPELRRFRLWHALPGTLFATVPTLDPPGAPIINSHSSTRPPTAPLHSLIPVSNDLAGARSRFSSIFAFPLQVIACSVSFLELERGRNGQPNRPALLVLSVHVHAGFPRRLCFRRPDTLRDPVRRDRSTVGTTPIASMTDYFSEYSSYTGKGIPSPIDTPYETPSFIRSKRSSRATIGGSSREQSTSPPPLPSESDFQEKSRDGRNGFSGMDPRRFTPTLHASLVSEILNLRRELDSKNGLVENLEASLANVKSEHDTMTKTLSLRANEVKKAKKQVQEMEKGTFDAVENLVQERDVAQQTAEDLKLKLETVTKKVRIQDEDALRTQGIWESEKESWENERRQLERRVHVTENRLRTFVDEMSAHQAVLEAQNAHETEVPDDSTFKDSGLGQESDGASIISTASPHKHKRNMSSISSKTRSIRFSNTSRYTAGTPEPHARPNGYSLADELGIDEEDEDEMDDYEAADDDLELSHAQPQTLESHQDSVESEIHPQPKHVPESMKELPESSTGTIPMATSMEDSQTNGFSSETVEVPKLEPPAAAIRSLVQYVDNGYQPSPPSSPLAKEAPKTIDPSNVASIPTILEPSDDAEAVPDSDASRSRPPHGHTRQATTSEQIAGSAISPPPIKVPDDEQSHPKPALSYCTTSTQTDEVRSRLEPPPNTLSPKRDSLSPPMFVPAIAIHPPTSRPSSPRPYVLPPGTKNVSCQANLSWSSVDASMQTEEIRVDKRLRLSEDFLRSRLLPSPSLSESFSTSQTKRMPKPLPGKILTQLPQVSTLASPSSLAMSPTDVNADLTRDSTSKDLRSLRALPLPRPVLSPVEGASEGPLNRSSQYGVTRPLHGSSSLADIDADSDVSDEDDFTANADARDMAVLSSIATRAPHGRYGLSEPPKVVPEHKEISPERRPGTGESYAAAPAPSVASSRANSRAARKQPPTKLSQYGNHRSRSPSFGSFASSSFSKESNAHPPYPIPVRSSSRVLPPKTYSEGSHSPTPLHTDFFGQDHRPAREDTGRRNSLRKVQSANAMRAATRKTSPNKHRRRRRSPNLTPVQSMAFDTPEPTQFPIPELPTPLQEGLGEGFNKASMSRPDTGKMSTSEGSPETALVDAIAATMVGEWMWKYIRKRKSFGIGDEQSSFPIADHHGQMNMTAHGTRHKRWVWLSPYERTIMWDTKQPTSGSALLGKKGRKFLIQSILDVQDNTPTPKGADLETAFKRSILILTPARALKFTAINHERHMLWMTALSFLAQSPSVELPQSLPPELPPPLPPLRAPPPIPGAVTEAEQPGRKRSPSFGRANLRDSVRLAKGRHGSHQGTASTDASTVVSSEAPAVQDHGADFPAVPRLYSGTSRHQRKRSNTSPRLPASLNNFRSFSASAVGSLSSSSAATNGNHTRLHPAPGPSVRHSSSSKSGSTRESLASHHDRPNFFEAVGTVRMEAFVDPSVIDNVIYVPAPHQMRRQRGESTSTTDKRRAGYVFDDFGVDPFRGF
nr:anucleate primary sterigmata protein a [Quercus suber]